MSPAGQSESIVDRRVRPPAVRGSSWPLALASGLLVTTLCTLGAWRLEIHSMEGIIALGSEHMLRTGEWFVPKLYGSVYAYKPALAYWLTGASMHALGRTEFAVRLPTILCSIVLCMAVFWTLARLAAPRCGLYAALAACTCVLFTQLSRTGGFEMPLALGIGVSVLCAARNLTLRQTSLGWWLLAYLGLVFGFLAKGLPAFGLFGPGLLVAALALGQFRKLFAWQHLLSALLAVLAVGVYLALAYHQEGLATFQNQWSEISDRSAMWNQARFRQMLLKPPAIWVAFLPASAILLCLPLVGKRVRGLPVFNQGGPGRKHPPLRTRRLATTLWCFLLTSVVVWMLIPTMVMHYYLPLIVPLAGLAGLTAERLSPGAFHPYSREPGLSRWRIYQPGLIMALPGLLYWVLFAGFAQPAKAAARSQRPAAAAFASHLQPREQVYIDAFDSGSMLFYYLAHPVGKWNLHGRPVANNFAVILQDDQLSELRERTDLSVEVLERSATKEGRPWLLTRVSCPDLAAWDSAHREPPPPSIYQMPPWLRAQAREARKEHR